MFGLEGQKGKKGKPDMKAFTFDLEEKLKSPKAMDDLKQKVHEHLHELKRQLQEGLEGEAFEEVGYLIYGYVALLKVMGRIPTKGKK